MLVVGFDAVVELLLLEEEDGSELLALLLSDGSPDGSEELLSLSDGSELSEVDAVVGWNSWSSGRSLKDRGAPQATSASRSNTLSADRNTLFISNAFLHKSNIENGLVKRRITIVSPRPACHADPLLYR